MPRKKKKRRPRNATKGAKKSKPPARKIEYISVPKHWFSDPLQHKIKTVVRPPTALTRRKEQIIEVKVPEEIFLDLVRPLENGDMEKFEWMSPEKSALKPTKEGKSFNQFKYKVSKPEVTDKIWRLHEHEKGVPVRKRSGEIEQTRRGHGSARLHLSHAAEERGEKTDLMAQVVGNVTLDLKVPKQERAMPTLKLTLKVATMDGNGHIIWPATFSARTAAALRKQMRSHMKAMIDGEQYPTLTSMVPSLTHASESTRPTAGTALAIVQS